MSPIMAADPDSLLSITNIQNRLNSVKEIAPKDEAALLAKNLEDTLSFLEKAKTNREEITVLEQKIKDAPSTLKKYQENIQNIKADMNNVQGIFIGLPISKLEVQQSEINQQLERIREQLDSVGLSLVSYRSALESTRTQILDNNLRADTLARWKYNSKASKSLIDKYNAELDYIDVNNKYNLILGQNIDVLISIDENKKTELTFRQQLLQQKLFALQEELNASRLKEFEDQAKQTQQNKEDSNIANPVIQYEFGLNSDLSEYLVTQTQKTNSLSQENLRIRNVLDALTQTKRNIEEQISALQGTLILSRIINQQKESLPTDGVIKGLSKDINNLRVELFETTQQRDELYDIPKTIEELQIKNNLIFTNEEKGILNNIFKEREKIFTDLIKSFNSQLSLSNNIELIQKQIIQLSDELERQLQQQSFWVKSNNPIDLTWLENFPQKLIAEITELSSYVSFENANQNLFSKFSFLFFFVVVYAVIHWKKEAIKHRLSVIAAKVNTLKNDNHWVTPEAIFWTLILTLPGALAFLIFSTILMLFFFSDPLVGFTWLTEISIYWWFFATTLELFRPHGLAYLHFDLPQASNLIFRRIIRQSVWIVVLLVISSTFSDVDTIGFNNDVIGEVVTIVALLLCFFIVRPWLDKGICEYRNAVLEDGSKRSIGLFNLLRLVLFIVPIFLIVLIILGYYYTAVYIIEHIIKSYLAALVWVFGRYFVYRFLTISSRRMAYRRLQNERELLRSQDGEKVKERAKEDTKEEKIRISVVNRQLFHVADLIGWVVLFGFLYAIWSDLISIAYYLNGVVLWEQVETTSQGVMVESITLLNMLRSIVYVVVTYVLVKNISGILEVAFFSRVRLSKGAPHTIIAVLTYFIVTLGSIASFSALGLSWNKLQWIFTALSVGLGFGLREIFGSIISGIILLFERPIRVGDKVTVERYTGFVSNIRLRSTVLVDNEKKEVVLPNQAFVTGRFINWTLNNSMTRLRIMLKVSHDADLDLVEKLLYQIADEAPKVLKDPEPEVNLSDIGEGWVEHEFVACVGELWERVPTRNLLYKRIHQIFKEHGIKFAFQQVDVHLHNDEDAMVQKSIIQQG
ncbi:potassium efflux system protein [Otariodibacter oris]|uniref:Potassium efflux system protein n=2 Tax=Otariodibacter oris TaxID=1032623 RepID=A0A420XIR3_9PAST|nr:mechanosensitive channel MscK [Otariodibacter oris]RKR77202.1 potassium efflux system protein [Otariodibacter oris]